jgi:hypothetical protein
LLKSAELPRESLLTHNNQAEGMVRFLGLYTLALIQAGAYIRQSHGRLDKYSRVYRRRQQRAQSRYCDVYATFETSASILEQSESETAKDALHLLEILSVLDPGILPLQISQAAWDGAREVCANRREASNIDAVPRSHVSRLPSFIVVEGNEWDSYRLIGVGSLLLSLSLVAQRNSSSSFGLPMHLLTHAWAKDRQDYEQQSVA